jgi:pimeloyl-ACP methyl ester carboxylesterase
MSLCQRIILLAIAAVSITTAANAQQKRAGDLTIKPYVFQPQGGEKVDAEFGVLLVPENRNDPKSNLIELAFVRFKSTSKIPGPPIVYLAGGPGGSGIGAARSSRFPLFMAMREIGDVIALDQRGVGRSKPEIGCIQTVDFPLDVPATREEFLRIFKERARDCARYWRDVQRVDLRGYNTNESADDLESLRKALGASKISLWGISYGTHLSLTAIRRHGKNIHRAILAGIEGPDHTLKLPSNVQKHLEDIDRVVKADPELSKDIPDFLGLVKSVLDRLEREPVTVEVTDPRSKQKVKVIITKFVFQVLTASNIGTTLIRDFPSIYYSASKGDYSYIAQVWLNESRREIGSAMSLMMDCASGASAERLARIERESKATLLGNLADYVFPDVCEVLDSPDLGPDFRAPVKSDVPTLFISGTLDARTPISNAEEYRAGFTNSHHLIIDGAVHSDPLFLSSPKIKEVMLEFMKGQTPSTTSVTLAPFRFSRLKKVD